MRAFEAAQGRARPTMQESEVYNAVYHFLDDQLFAAFIEGVPRSQITEYLRNNETVRNRHFRGFRISGTVPSNQQIVRLFGRKLSTGITAASLRLCVPVGFASIQT